jgi:hypothetical protein
MPSGGDSETGSGSFAYSPPPPLGAPPLAPSPPPPPPLLPPFRAAGLSLLAAGASHPVSLPQTLHHLYPLFLPSPLPHLVWCFRLDRLERVSMLLALPSPALVLPCQDARERTEERVTSCRVKSRARRVQRAHVKVRRVTPARVRHKLP